MNGQLQVQVFTFGQLNVQLLVPNPQHVQLRFQQLLKDNPALPSPYWSQVWPAAISLSQFIVDNSHYVLGKKVLELAGGLGMPSMVAARYADWVCCSDYVQEAVDSAAKSAHMNGLKNMDNRLIDWNHIQPDDWDIDVLLLSDINYEPTVFETLFSLLEQFLKKGTTVMLSTPQRMMAKPFIERLLPWMIFQKEITVLENVHTSILVLKMDTYG
jgi:predicted nicotinamide N-methyase